MTQATLTLTPPDTVGEVGDELDRHYTPVSLARLIVQRLAAWLPRDPAVLLEPSVGSGAFIVAAKEVWPDVHCIGVDVDPQAPGKDLVDEFVFADFIRDRSALTTRSVDLIVGNPPFTGKRGLDHVEACLTFDCVTCLILPWSFLGGVRRWSHLMTGDGAPSDAWPIPSPRPWGDKVRETSAFVWGLGGDPGRTEVRALPRWR